jgi:hypothetical protein
MDDALLSRQGSTGVGGSSSPVLDDAVTRRAVAAARNGDRSALDYLYVRYVGDLFDYLYDLTGDHQRARELALRVMAEVPRRHAAGEAPGLPFSLWLKVIGWCMTGEVAARDV